MTRLIFMLIAVAFVGIFSGIIFAQDAPLNGGTLRGTIVDVTPAQNPIEGVEVKIVAQDGTEHSQQKRMPTAIMNARWSSLLDVTLISIFREGIR